jgi:acyl-CoA dehydrogenase
VPGVDFAPDARTADLAEQLQAFLDERIYPAEEEFERQARTSGWERPPLMEELKAEGRKRGLWNLFLPKEHHDRHGYGAGLTNLQYAPLAELTGRSPAMAPEAVNSAAPDTGNMELLSLFGTEQQRAEWLEPLLAGEIRSAFSMT